jgi:hypothetical protein
MYEHTRLAAAGSRDDEHGFGRSRDRLTLRVIEVFKDRCDVHSALSKARKCSNLLFPADA